MRGRSIRAICLFLCVIAIGGCVGFQSASKKLSPGLTEQEVIQRVGAEPNRTELRTCGANSSSGSWQCKIYVYGYGADLLYIYFSSTADGIWRVNNWN